MLGRRDGRGLDLRAKRTWTAVGLLVFAVVAVVLPTASGANKVALKDVHATKSFWQKASLRHATSSKWKPAVRLRGSKVQSFTLNRAALRRVLVKAPAERTRAARAHPVVISLPAPNGRFERFALARSAIMSPGLARKHAKIGTYAGRGIDDRTATIHADL